MCAFALSGFKPEGSEFPVMGCGSWYHPRCFHVGAPFTTRNPNEAGLGFPRGAEAGMFPNFICEACQVRAVVGRELTHDTDLDLLAYERMRLVDSMNTLAESTLKNYKYPIRRVKRFAARHGIKVLQPTPISRPPGGPTIPLIWSQYEHSLGKGADGEPGLKFSSARGQRSAASAYFRWDALASHPGRVLQTGETCDFREQVLPTDELAYTAMSKGMKKRLGTEANKSQALRYTHIRFLDDQFRSAYNSATTNEQRQEMATAGLANVLFWTSWLRSQEGFNLEWADLHIVRPGEGQRHGLPNHLGCVGVSMDKTKTAQDKKTDVIMSYHCWSGLSLGYWLELTSQFEPADGKSVFSTPLKEKWDSHYFRTQHVYPHLEVLRALGEPGLANCSDEPGQRIADRFWSMHSWRRGADGFVQRHWEGINKRAARLDEIYEHARWRLTHRGRGEAMHVHYREWEIRDRVLITYLCM